MVKKIILLGLLVAGLYANEMETVDVKVCVDTTKHADKSFKQMDEMLVSMAQEEGFNSLYNRELGKENKNALTMHHRKDLIVKVNEQLDEGNNFCNSSTVSIKKDRLQYYLPQKVSKDRICHKDGNLSPAQLKEAAALKGYKALIAEVSDKKISDDLAKTLVHDYQRDDGKLYRAQGAYCFGASGEVVPFEVEMGSSRTKSSQSIQNNQTIDKTILQVNQKWYGYYICGKKTANLVVTIKMLNEKSVKATFDFNYPNSNSKGIYEMYGTLDKKRKKLVFDDFGAWIYNPNKYKRRNMAGMSGYIFDGTYSGSLTNACGGGKFELKSEKQNLEQNVRFEKGQIWRGQYDCVQGKTNLDLKIEQVFGNDIKAIFDFNHNNRAVGKFELFGKYNPDNNTLKLTPGKWLYNPNRFNSVGMIGTVNKNRYKGNIIAKGCKDFDLTLVQ